MIFKVHLRLLRMHSVHVPVRMNLLLRPLNKRCLFHGQSASVYSAYITTYDICKYSTLLSSMLPASIFQAADILVDFVLLCVQV